MKKKGEYLENYGNSSQQTFNAPFLEKQNKHKVDFIKIDTLIVDLKLISN